MRYRFKIFLSSGGGVLFLLRVPAQDLFFAQNILSRKYTHCSQSDPIMIIIIRFSFGKSKTSYRVHWISNFDYVTKTDRSKKLKKKKNDENWSNSNSDYSV